VNHCIIERRIINFVLIRIDNDRGHTPVFEPVGSALPVEHHVPVDPDQDEVYYTPLYYTMVHFSRFIRPGAVRIGFDVSDEHLMATAVENPDGSIVVVLLNQDDQPKSIVLTRDVGEFTFRIDARALQTLTIAAPDSP
jgi:O-glycosyl hydrolase